LTGPARIIHAGEKKGFPPEEEIVYLTQNQVGPPAYDLPGLAHRSTKCSFLVRFGHELQYRMEKQAGVQMPDIGDRSITMRRAYGSL